MADGRLAAPRWAKGFLAGYQGGKGLVAVSFAQLSTLGAGTGKVLPSSVSVVEELGRIRLARGALVLRCPAVGSSSSPADRLPFAAGLGASRVVGSC